MQISAGSDSNATLRTQGAHCPVVFLTAPNPILLAANTGTITMGTSVSPTPITVACLDTEVNAIKSFFQSTSFFSRYEWGQVTDTRIYYVTALGISRKVQYVKHSSINGFYGHIDIQG
jgi:hypothetical protein